MGAISMLMLVACGLVGVMSFAEIPMALDDSTARAGGTTEVCNCKPRCSTNFFNNCMKNYAKFSDQGIWQFCLKDKVTDTAGCIAANAVGYIANPNKNTCAAILSDKTNRIGLGTNQGKCNKIKDKATCEISYARLVKVRNPQTRKMENIIEQELSDATFDGVFVCQWTDGKCGMGATYQGCFQSAMMAAAMTDGKNVGPKMLEVNKILNFQAPIDDTLPDFMTTDL